jgi:isopentenyl-diphosphate Delta-isomerase
VTSEENSRQFEARKLEHLKLSLSPEVQAEAGNGFDQIQLIHEALPDLDFSEIQIQSEFLGFASSKPFFISSMTAGHPDSLALNELMARVATRHHWPMAVGSQRRELTDASAGREWIEIRKRVPEVKLIGNIGLAQLIQTPVEKIEKLVENLQAVAFFVHSNPLQEALQGEGTPQFKGGLKALDLLSRKLSVPVIFKETGCGISESTLKRLSETNIKAVDVAGFGGTHWGRIEGLRASPGSLLNGAALTFANWGLDTLSSLMSAAQTSRPYEIWASGGIRSGLDGAKALALGAVQVGLAQPILKAAMQGEESLDQFLVKTEYELRVAMFCTGSSTIKQLQIQRWQWIKKL